MVNDVYLKIFLNIDFDYLKMLGSMTLIFSISSIIHHLYSNIYSGDMLKYPLENNLQQNNENYTSVKFVVCIFFLTVKLLSRVRLFATPWTVAYQVPPSMGFSRHEYWSGLPFPSPGNLPYPGIEPGSPAL